MLRRLVYAALLLGVVFCSEKAMHAQGCSACRDATAGSAPKAREGLRRAILVLGLPAAGIFVTVFFVARRIEQRREP